MKIETLCWKLYEGLGPAQLWIKDPDVPNGVEAYQVLDENDDPVAEFTSRETATWFAEIYPTLAIVMPTTYTYRSEDIRPNCPHCHHPVEQPDDVNYPEVEWYAQCNHCGVAEWFQLEEDENEN